MKQVEAHLEDTANMDYTAFFQDLGLEPAPAAAHHGHKAAYHAAPGTPTTPSTPSTPSTLGIPSTLTRTMYRTRLVG